MYNKDYRSQLLFRWQTNNLQLNNRNRLRGKETACDVCGAERENLRQFLLWCPGYCEVRGKNAKLQEPYIQEEEDTVERFLSESRDLQETKK